MSSAIETAEANNGINVIYSKFDKFDVLSSLVICNAASNDNIFTNENAMLIVQCVQTFLDAIVHVNYRTHKIIANFNLSTPNYEEVVLRKIVQEMNCFAQRAVNDDMRFMVSPWSNHDWRIYISFGGSVFDLRCEIKMETEYADDGVHCIYGRFELI